MENKKELQKEYPTHYKLLIAQDLWQAHYQILLLILLKEFIKLNVKTDTMIKQVKLSELNKKITTTFLSTENLKITQQITNVFTVKRNIKKSLMKT